MENSLQSDRWDVFISHASEDKDAVAIPIAQELERAGLTVWLDAHELSLGDNLAGKIDEGLRQSRFGAVILSQAFLAKDGPNANLAVFLLWSHRTERCFCQYCTALPTSSLLTIRQYSQER